MNWLLLRGLIRESRHWAGFVERFERDIPGAKVHTLDFPGIGTESAHVSPVTIDGIVSDVRQRWLKLAETHPGEWAIFGVSLGGMVTLRWAQLFPADFRRIVAVNASAVDLSPPWKRLSAGRWTDLFGISRLANDTEKELRILDLTVNLRSDKPALAAEWATFAPPHRDRTNLAVRQLSAALTFSCPRRLFAPTLILRSQGDRLVDPECSERIARRLEARLVTHGLAGHDLPLDDAEWTIEELRRWIKES